MQQSFSLANAAQWRYNEKAMLHFETKDAAM